MKGPEVIFGERTNWHEIEIFHYLLMLIMIANATQNMTLLSVADFVVNDADISFDLIQNLNQFSSLLRLKFIKVEILGNEMDEPENRE